MSEKLKKISKLMKDQLRFLVEEFLEKPGPDITAKTGGRGDAAKTMWEQLEGILFADTFWMDEPGPEDMTDLEYQELLKYYHAILKPIWDQFKDALFEYKQGIIPERGKYQKAKENIERDPESPFYEYKELLQQTSALDLEKFYDIKLKKFLEPDTLTVSFESGRVTFYKRNLDVIQNFIDLLSGVDIRHFGRCEYCGKCIFLKRSDKRFCPGCSAKKIQKDKWANDPVGMKEKERVRYRERRKKH
jgi:hypothetical protein